MGRRKDFKQEMGTFVSPHGPVSHRAYKSGQVKWDLGSVGGRASLRKPEDDVQVVILAAMVESDLTGAAQPQPVPLKPIAAAAAPPPQHARPQTPDAGGRLGSDTHHMQWFQMPVLSTIHCLFSTPIIVTPLTIVCAG